MQEKWLPIIDYVRVTNSSISTVRRHIKKNKVKHKKVDGKYYILCDENQDHDLELANDKENLSLKLENIRLKNEIKELTIEVQELKMLLNVYEEKLTPPDLPALPEMPL